MKERLLLLPQWCKMDRALPSRVRGGGGGCSGPNGRDRWSGFIFLRSMCCCFQKRMKAFMGSTSNGLKRHSIFFLEGTPKYRSFSPSSSTATVSRVLCAESQRHELNKGVSCLNDSHFYDPHKNRGKLPVKSTICLRYCVKNGPEEEGVPPNASLPNMKKCLPKKTFCYLPPKLFRVAFH